jgi:hypothetical protein
MNMPGTTRTKTPRPPASKSGPAEESAAVTEVQEKAATTEATEATETTESTEQTPAPAAAVDFLALLSTAEDDTKSAAKTDERTAIHVPEEWIAKVKDTFENRKRVRIPGIRDKDTFAKVGDLVRAAADRIEKSATVRAVYEVPAGKEDTKENRVLVALTFTIGARRKGPQSKKSAAAVPPETTESAPVSVSDTDADSAPPSE